MKYTKEEGDDFNLEYYQDFYKKEEADNIFCYINKLEYNEKAIIKVFNKDYIIPRHQVAYGDDGVKYKYSGNISKALEWTPELLVIKNKVESVLKTKFNFCLINRYIDGEHTIGYHKDDEKELGDNPIIAGLSFGCERDILFKNKEKKILKKFLLSHGSLIVMRDPTNKYWYHSIPKRKKVKDVRISLTFRLIKK